MVLYRVEISRSAAKELSRDRPDVDSNIVATIEILKAEPRPSGCKKLVGSDHTYRLRIGDYRVIYDIMMTL